MEIITTPFSKLDAQQLIENNVDIILLTNSSFGVRNSFDCSNNHLEYLFEFKKQVKSNTKIWININAFFFEQDIEGLEEYLVYLNSKSNLIDKIVFNDFAIPQICFEKSLNLNLHYDPCTLVTSYGQFSLYQDNNINSVSLSNELFLPEVLMILKNKPMNFQIALQAHGYSFIMHSRWNLVTNFKNYVEDNNDEYIKNKVYYIKELSRQFANIIYEDKHGSHMLTGYELCILKQIKQLYENGLDYIKIDCIFQENGYSLAIYKLYKSLIFDIQNNEYDESKVDDLYQRAINISNKHILSSGFLGGIEGILNYEKK